MPRGVLGSRLRLIAAIALVASLTSTAEAAEVDCSYDDGVVTVTIDGAASRVLLDRSSEGTIQLDGAFCPGPEPTYATVTNTDLIQITDESDGQAAILEIDLARGGFTPGRTPESSGTSEIEIEHSLSSGTDAGGFRIVGTSASERFTFGSDAIEVTGDDDEDIDFASISNLDVLAYGGHDVVSGRGSSVTGGPAPYQTFLLGDVGNDELSAGDLYNYLGGGPGDDALRGFAGNEDLLAGGEGADLIDGGAGSGDMTYYGTSVQAVTVNLETSTVDGGEAEGDTLANIESVFGTDFADDIVGNSVANYLIGGLGGDRLIGGGGDDRLQGSGGNDEERGGDGNDTFEQDDHEQGADDLYGEAGDADSVSYTLRNEPVSVTRDNVANDGEAGEDDNVHSDIEIVRTKDNPGPPPPQSTPSGSGSPSPTPSGSGTPSPSPSGSSTPSPSPSGSGTPSPSPSGSSSPSPRPSPTEPACTERWRAIDDDADRSGRWIEGIAVRGSRSAWVAGSTSTNQGRQLTLVERWDGRSWQREESYTVRRESTSLRDIDAPPRGPVWTVGTSSRLVARTVALKRVNGRWRDTNPANPSSSLSAFSAVAVLSRRNVWAVGTRWDAAGRHLVLIERWNGRRWAVAPVGTEGLLDGVFARRANDVWAVGRTVRQNTARTLALHYNGSRWRKIPSPNETDKPHYLMAVDGRARDDVWAVGYRDAGRYPRPIVIHWNGDRWRRVEIPDLQGELLGVSVSGREVVAVGYYTSRREGSRALILTKRDGPWKLEDTTRFEQSIDLQDVEHSPEGDVFAAGVRSTRGVSEVILHRRAPC